MEDESGNQGQERPLPDTTTWREAFRATACDLRQLCIQPFAAPSHHDAIRATGPEEPDDNATAGPLDPNQARQVGLVVHEALELWEPDSDIPLPDLGHRLSAHHPELMVEVREILERFESGPLAERMRNIRVLGKEIPILMNKGGGQIWRGFIDLLYEDEDGRTVVVDFKTDTGLEPGTARKLYEDQLSVYGQAVQKALELPTAPRMELWMIRDGSTISIDPLTGKRQQSL
jgi:hypothetical protein